MIKIMDACILFNYQVEKVHNEFNDNLVFIKPSDYSERGEFGYKAVLVVNIKSMDTMQYILPSNTKIINSTNSKNTFYYAQLELGDNKSCVNVWLRKLDLETMKDTYLGAIEIDIKDQDEPLNYVALNSKIVGINERYCLFFAPCEKLQYGPSYFSKCLLIDSFENKIITVKDGFINGDSLLKLQDIWVVNDTKNIIIKTGRIQIFEKREFWDKSIENGEIPSYFDQNESLVFVSTELFIDRIKRNEELTGILDSSDYTSAISFCGWDGYKLTFMKHHFKEGKNVIITYKLDSEMFERKEIEDSCEIVCTTDKYFVVQPVNDENIRFSVRDLTSNTVVQINGYGIIALDEDKIITHNFNKNFEHVVCLSNVHTGELIKEFKTPNFDYDLEKDLLTIY
ncbi:hypothetical protein J2Z69_003375 [Paenibacillus shirakamiensis]|uniref:Uncharacterized protein n=1 Tax=Paenibacillus shirakamiensis TaxID=1265935 RepID=A0ABS4JKS4_9BACL|nr:hypothetical protein [Paenibacillus shirakamiensis]MBP2002303.1 hypothetical protein [Paenibacillus shirakamiensis]